MRGSTDSLGAPPLSLLIASVIVAIIKIPKKKTSSPNVKEKRKAGTCSGLTKAAIAAAAATLQRRERTRALGFAPSQTRCGYSLAVGVGGARPMRPRDGVLSPNPSAWRFNRTCNNLLVR